MQAKALAQDFNPWARDASFQAAVKAQLPLHSELNHSQKLAVGRGLLSTFTLWQVWSAGHIHGNRSHHALEQSILKATHRNRSHLQPKPASRVAALVAALLDLVTLKR